MPVCILELSVLSFVVIEVWSVLYSIYVSCHPLSKQAEYICRFLSNFMHSQHRNKRLFLFTVSSSGWKVERIVGERHTPIRSSGAPNVIKVMMDNVITGFIFRCFGLKGTVCGLIKCIRIAVQKLAKKTCVYHDTVCYAYRSFQKLFSVREVFEWTLTLLYDTVFDI